VSDENSDLNPQDASGGEEEQKKTFTGPSFSKLGMGPVSDDPADDEVDSAPMGPSFSKLGMGPVSDNPDDDLEDDLDDLGESQEGAAIGPSFSKLGMAPVLDESADGDDDFFKASDSEEEGAQDELEAMDMMETMVTTSTISADALARMRQKRKWWKAPEGTPLWQAIVLRVACVLVMTLGLWLSIVAWLDQSSFTVETNWFSGWFLNSFVLWLGVIIFLLGTLAAVSVLRDGGEKLTSLIKDSEFAGAGLSVSLLFLAFSTYMLCAKLKEDYNYDIYAEDLDVKEAPADPKEAKPKEAKPAAKEAPKEAAPPAAAAPAGTVAPDGTS